MARIKVTQVKSHIDRSKRQKETIKALGLGKINKSNVFETNAQIEVIAVLAVVSVRFHDFRDHAGKKNERTQAIYTQHSECKQDAIAQFLNLPDMFEGCYKFLH